ncbi:MAG: 3-phosphoserine/phosphohydroxythreonine transaminase [Christensenellales bacterium]|jgi:phosphoserine aminotransferase
MKVYNFSAGPSMLPYEVKLQAQKEMLDYNGSGMSVMEMSHRSKVYEEIHNEAIALLKEIMRLNDDYYILLLQGGASTQFEAVPLNLLKNGKADYIVTGNFASKAYKEAKKYGEINEIASSKDANYTYIPDMDKIKTTPGADYLHITSNNTIFGTRYTKFPEVDIPLVADMSSNILSQDTDYNKFGLIYAGAQKNIGPAGLTIVIVKKNLINNPMPICPTMLRYSTMANDNSLYNTPATFSIYVAMLTLRWIKNIGGIKALEKQNYEKANLLYDFIDNSSFYKNPVRPRDRSIMNVPFTTPSPELDAKFVKEAEGYGLVTLKGHRLVGGMRASIYNAMPMEGVKALVEFMKKFERENA